MTVLRAGLLVRQARPDDAAAIADLYQRVYRGGYPMAECTDPDLVRQVVSGAEHTWTIAVAADAVVGSVRGRRDPGRGRYELCRVVVDPALQGRALFGSLVSVAFRAVLARADCELIYGRVRSEHARRATDRCLPGARWTASDGGMHVHDGVREEHLYCVLTHPRRTVTRIVPHQPLLLPDSVAAREVSRLRTDTRTGAYPARLAARDTTGHIHESSRGRVSYSVFAPSHAAVVDSVEADTPDDVREVLWELLDGPIDHLTLAALADKLPLIEALCHPVDEDPERRFRARGYLPAWHPEDGARYDCVPLTATSSRRVPLRHGLEPWITDIRRSLPPRLR